MFAKCSKDPKGHKFSIDARTLKGKESRQKPDSIDEYFVVYFVFPLFY